MSMLLDLIAEQPFFKGLVAEHIQVPAPLSLP